MKIAPIAILSAFVFLSVFCQLGLTEAAHLEPVDQEILVDGKPDSPPETVFEPEAITVNPETSVDPEATPSNPAFHTHTYIWTATYDIQPDPGDQIGDCVALYWSFTGSAGASANSNGDSMSGIGGAGVSAGSNPPWITFSESAEIVLNPSTSPQTIFSFDPVLVADGENSFFYQRGGKFNAQVGDQVHVRAGSASAGAAYPPDGSASAQSSVYISVSLIPCDYIPTLNQCGLIILSVILSASALLAVRRKIKAS